MTISSYQPFLIGQGQQKTGLFTYLESWIKPDDAWDTLENAYVYKGVLYQRPGMQLYQSAAGNGSLVYIDSVQIGTGNGSKKTFNFTFTKLPVVANASFPTVTVWAIIGGVVQSITDNGTPPTGTFTGTQDNGSTIVYATGVLTAKFVTAPDNSTPVWATWGYVPNQITTGSKVYNPIMGIKQFTSPTTGKSITVVMDTRRASFYDQNSKSFVALNQFSQVIWQQFSTATTTGGIHTQFTNITPLSVVITDGPDTTTDDGAGNIIASGNISGGTVVYSTGIVTVTWTSAITVGAQVTITADVTGDYFTGDNTNFFNATNWRFNDVQGDFLYFTNNVDPVTLFNGTQLSRPLFNTTLAEVQDFSYSNAITIKTTLDIKVYKNRLLFIRPTLVGSTIPEAQTVRFSQQQTFTTSPTVIFSSYNFAADVAGNGGFVNCPTGDWLMASQLIRDILVVFATNSTWNLRFTGSAFDPYRFDQINSTRSTSAPYGTVPYDTNATSMGIKGLISCDSVAVDRYDIPIIDQFEQIHQSGFANCFAQKYDTFNQTWMLYPSESNNLLTNDSALIFNYLENTWATAIPNMGFLATSPSSINTLSCLGLGLNVEDITWADFAPGSGSEVEGLTWSECNFPWFGFLTQTLSSVLLGGDQNGFVYQLYSGVTDTGLPVKTFCSTKRFNPFAANALMARFGYLDVYYEINTQITLSFNFYVNNSESPSNSQQVTLDGPLGQNWAWKRVYLNLVGEFVQIEITNEVPTDSGQFNTGGSFKILGMILHASPAGRITPSTFL
jgi:hypothetical protein